MTKFLSKYKILTNDELGVFGHWLVKNQPVVKNVEVYLTIDPYEMMRCSMDCTYKSCFRADGEYKYAPTAYISTPEAAMLYTLNEQGKKNFRVWGLMSKYALVIGRLYGDEQYVKAVGGVISHYLKDYLNLYEREKYRHKVFYPEVEFYWDTPSFVAGDGDIVINSPFDSDGCELEGTIECSHCHHRADEVDVVYTSDNEPICTTCMEKYYYICQHCEEVHFKKEGWHETSIGEVCNECYREHYTTCDRCGGITYKDDVISVYDNEDRYIETICSACVEELDLIEGYFCWLEQGEVHMRRYTTHHYKEDVEYYRHSRPYNGGVYYIAKDRETLDKVKQKLKEWSNE